MGSEKAAGYMVEQPHAQNNTVLFGATVAATLVYIAAITAAEAIGAFVGIVPSAAGHALLIVLMLSQYVLMSRAPDRRVLPVHALAPLLRLLSLTMPIRQAPQVYWLVMIGVPLLVAAWLTARLLGLSWQQVGLRPRSWWAQLAIALSGLPLSLVAFLALRPAPLMADLDWWSVASAVTILMIFTGFAEELIFRGLLQHVAEEVFGRKAMLYTSVLFAALYLGSLSPSYILVIGLIGLWFAWCAHRTGSIWGVILAHSLINVGMVCVWPFTSIWRIYEAALRTAGLAGLALGLLGAIGTGVVILSVRRRAAGGSPAAIAPVQREDGVQSREAIDAGQAPVDEPAKLHDAIVRCSLSEPARRLGVSQSTVRRRIKAGRLAAERAGAGWIVLLSVMPAPDPDGAGATRGTLGIH